MNVNELRIGNLVRGNMVSVFRIDQIHLTDHQGYVARMYPNNDIASYVDLQVSRAEPIRLNDKILLMCGFKQATEYIFDHESGVVFDAPNDWIKSGKYPTEINCTMSVMGFNPEQIIIRTLTLHDLQNKFFAITGKELNVANFLLSI